jgi:hypothetical protein
MVGSVCVRGDAGQKMFVAGNWLSESVTGAFSGQACDATAGACIGMCPGYAASAQAMRHVPRLCGMCPLCGSLTLVGAVGLVRVSMSGNSRGPASGLLLVFFMQSCSAVVWPPVVVGRRSWRSLVVDLCQPGPTHTPGLLVVGRGRPSISLPSSRPPIKSASHQPPISLDYWGPWPAGLRCSQRPVLACTAWNCRSVRPATAASNAGRHTRRRGCGTAAGLGELCGSCRPLPGSGFGAWPGRFKGRVGAPSRQLLLSSSPAAPPHRRKQQQRVHPSSAGERAAGARSLPSAPAPQRPPFQPWPPPRRSPSPAVRST